MKKLLKVALVAICMLFVGNFAKAQTKIGYINFGELIREMPEAKTVQTAIESYQKQFIDQLTVMNNTLQTEAKNFQAQSATMTDAVRTSKQAELQDMQKRMQDYQNSAQTQVEAKSNELIKPVSDKCRAAVADVAKEKGYTYVFDSSQGAPLIVSPEGDDLMVPVKAKLGLK
jgi:outer membrane protein